VVKTVIYKPKGVTLLDYSDKLKDYPEHLSTLIAEKLAPVISTHAFFYSSGPTSVSHLKSCKHYTELHIRCAFQPLCIREYLRIYDLRCTEEIVVH
jgi:hypothetical protein